MVWLSRAARQLFYILGEGLRRQLQALDHRQVREQLVGELLHRHACPDGQCGGLDDLARFWRDRLHPDEPAAAGLSDQLAKPVGVRSEERRVGKECGSTGRSRWSLDHKKKKTK